LSYEYLFLDEIEPSLPAARAAGVDLNRGPLAQHLAAYRRVQAPERIPTHLRVIRDATIRRVVRRQGSALWFTADGQPTRSHLLCIAFGYSPMKGRYLDWLDSIEGAGAAR